MPWSPNNQLQQNAELKRSIHEMRKINRQEWIVVGIAGVLLLGAALFVHSARWRTEERIMIDGVSRHLKSMLSFLAATSSGETYPDAETAMALFAKAPAEVHTTQGLIDGFQYATSPVGRDESDILVVAQVRKRHFAIAGSGETKELTQNEFISLSLATLKEPGENRTTN